MPLLDPSTGLLPAGRYVCSLDEIKASFVDGAWTAASATRSGIWNDFVQATSKLVSLVGPDCAQRAWIGGSFTTSRLDPDDIDVTYILDADKYDALSNAKKKRVTSFGKKGHVRATTGLRVDAFTLTHTLVPEPWLAPTLSAAEIDYFKFRGMWDDWWERHKDDRSTPSTMADARQRRGYLEVRL